jgi:hypothetical protein
MVLILYRLLRSINTAVDECPSILLIWDPNDSLALFTSYPWT